MDDHFWILGIILHLMAIKLCWQCTSTSVSHKKTKLLCILPLIKPRKIFIRNWRIFFSIKQCWYKNLTFQWYTISIQNSLLCYGLCSGIMVRMLTKVKRKFLIPDLNYDLLIHDYFSLTLSAKTDFKRKLSTTSFLFKQTLLFHFCSCLFFFGHNLTTSCIFLIEEVVRASSVILRSTWNMHGTFLKTW